MFVVRYRKIWFGISAILFAISIAAMLTYGFKLSIDFKGGTITEAKYLSERPDKASIEEKIAALDIGGFSIRPSGETNYIVRSRELNESERSSLQSALGISSTTNGTIERQNTIGPVAGSQLQGKAVKAIGTVVLMIVLFVTFAFRGVSKPARPDEHPFGRVSSWKYGFATIIALLHDVIIPLGLFVILGHLFGTEIDLLFVTGILAVLGYSVHDTIVVFDRVRENLTINTEKKIKEDFETTVGKSVSQTFGRSINTSLTIFITLLALYIFGSSATKEFSLLLLVGVVIGTYSSIFIGSPLLVTFQKWQKKDK